jgi:ATP/maltotriose-dependent transcriptional regulator MalT
MIRELPVLTMRQREIVECIRDGCTIEETAKRLDISFHTARTHVRTIAATLPGDFTPVRRIREHADRLLAMTG